MRWIGLSGRMGAGKDYTLQQLQTFDRNFKRVSFADQLRIEIKETLGYEITKPYSELERRLQQWWGTDFRRAQDPNYWVKKGIAAGIEAEGQGRYPVFTDVRFPNEAEAIRVQGGLIVRIEAPHSVRAQRLGMTPPNHESETAMDDYPVDFTIYSVQRTGYLEQLSNLVARASFDDTWISKRMMEALNG